MRVRGRWAFVTVALLALVLIGSALAATAGHRTAQAKAPIIIGWAFDGKGAMAPFDGPALAAAQLRVALVNAKGGSSRSGRATRRGMRPQRPRRVRCAYSARRPTSSSRPATSTSRRRW